MEDPPQTPASQGLGYLRRALVESFTVSSLDPNSGRPTWAFGGSFGTVGGEAGASIRTGWGTSLSVIRIPPWACLCTAGSSGLKHTSRRLILPWFCTRELDHQGQHLAGTGEWVAAVHSQLLPSTRATSVSV